MQEAEITFVLTGPDPLLFPLWRDLDMGFHRIVRMLDGTDDDNAATVRQVRLIPKGDKGDKGDPGDPGSTAIDTDGPDVDALADFAIDLTQPCPSDINGVSMDIGKAVLLTKQPAAGPIPANYQNGPYVVNDTGYLERRADFASGTFVSSNVAGRGYRLHVMDADAAPGAAFYDTYWEMTQTAGITVDAQGNTWAGPLTSNVYAIPAGTMMGGPVNPKSPNRPMDDVRIKPDHLGRFMDGVDGAQRVSPWWILRRSNLASNYWRHDTAWDGRQCILAALTRSDEVVLDSYEYFFPSTLVLPATWRDKRIICDPGKAREGHVVFRCNQGGLSSGGIRFSGSRWDIRGHLQIATVDQYTGTSVNFAGVAIDDGVTDINFEALTCDGFSYNFYFINAASRIRVREWGSFNPSVAGVDANCTTSGYITDVVFENIRSDAATTIIAGSAPPDHFRLGRHCGSATELGVTLKRGKFTGGNRGVVLQQLTAPTAVGLDSPDRPRNIVIEDLVISGTVLDPLAFTEGSDVALERVRTQSAGQHGLNLGQKFQGALTARHCRFVTSQRHGVSDSSLFGKAKTFEDCIAHSNSQAAAGTYSGFHADRGTQNLRLVRCVSGHSDSSIEANGWVRLGLLPSNGHTVTINGTVVTFKTSPSGALDVQIGADIATSLRNLWNVVSASADAQLVKCRFSMDEVNRLFVIFDSPGNTAGNAYTLAVSGSSLSVSGATLAGASGPTGQQKYGVEGVADGKYGCLLTAFDGRGNLTGAIG